MIKSKEELATEYALSQPVDQDCPCCGEGSKWIHYYEPYLAGYTLGREAMLSEVLEYLNKRHMECAPDSPLQIKTHFWADILSEHFAKDLESKFKGIEASEGKVEND